MFCLVGLIRTVRDKRSSSNIARFASQNSQVAFDDTRYVTFLKNRAALNQQDDAVLG